MIQLILDKGDEIKRICMKYKVKTLSITGSGFSGTGDPLHSDIDFIVEFNAGSKSFDNYIDLAFFLESLLMRNVDLLTNDSLTESFKNSIQGEVEYIEV